MTTDGPQVAVRCPRHRFGWRRLRRGFGLTLGRDGGPATCRDCRIVAARDEAPPDRRDGGTGPV